MRYHSVLCVIDPNALERSSLYVMHIRRVWSMAEFILEVTLESEKPRDLALKVIY